MASAYKPGHAIERVKLTAIGLLQVEESTIRIGCVLHDFLDLLFAEYAVLHAVVGFDHDHAHGSDAEEVPHLQRVRGRWVLPISQEPAGAGVSRKGLRGRNDPEVLSVRCYEQLASAGVGKLVPLELPPYVHGVFRPKVDGVGVAVAIRTLDDDAL